MSAEDTKELGLGTEPKSEWKEPEILGTDANGIPKRPIDLLAPDTELHKTILKYLKERLNLSETKMKQFHSRWRIAETKYQAYVDLSDHEEALKNAQQDKGKAPKVVSIVVPYNFATINTIVTYLVHTFLGRKPIFQVSTYKQENGENARMMETVLQYQAERTRLAKQLYQFFQDGEIYGVGIVQTDWTDEKGMRTVWKADPTAQMTANGQEAPNVRTREERIIYQGNTVKSLDPFMFFPDPRVPMHEVNRKGEFVFWRSFEGRHSLLKAEAAGQLKYIKDIGSLPTGNSNGSSLRALKGEGDANPGSSSEATQSMQANMSQIDQCSIEIIPKELGLGESEVPEKWLFSMANKKQIIQAEPAELDHDMHPVCVIEPYTLGYGFGMPGMSDYLGPVQDTVSWFINSHIHNVRAALNNMFLVDPSMIEMQDLKNPEPGKLIRLKKSAYGRDARSIMQQFNVQDVTSGHMSDLNTFMRMGDSLSAVNDNLRGIQESGGRKTATEVRTSGESASSRLASHSILISSQGIVDLAEQLSVNTQQNLEMEFYLQIVGEQGKKTPIRIGPEQISGDFYYPLHDGTLPLDRVALLDVWKEVFVAVQGDTELRSQYSLPKIFDHIAQLGGAKNMEQFKVTQQSPEAIAKGQASGNLAPINSPAAQAILQGGQ